MDETETPDRRLSSLIQAVAVEAATQYRVTPEEAAALIRAHWQARPDLQTPLLALLARPEPLSKLRRQRLVKDAVASARKAVYYHLRQYRAAGLDQGFGAARQALEALAAQVERAGFISDDIAQERERLVQALLLAHVSTRERLAEAETFFATLLSLLGGPPGSVLDVGCGVLPLLFPFSQAGIGTETGLRRYLACDRDAEAVAALAAWRHLSPALAPVVEAPRCWRVEKGWEALLDDADPARHGQPFDLALMLKLVPVLARQQPEALAVLARVPARRLLVTGAKEAMTKRHSIAKREQHCLETFAKRQELTILAPFETQSEIGFLLEKGQ